MNTSSLRYAGEIFTILSKGGFICSNSTNSKTRKLYEVIEEDTNFEDLYNYFSHINFFLEKGNKYYYFTRNEEKIDLERKLEKVYRWIDIFDFFKTFDTAFSVGFSFEVARIQVQLKTDADLKTKLGSVKRYTDGKKSSDTIKKLVETFVKDGFLELQDEDSDTYKVVSSFDYLENIIQTIAINEQADAEIPQ
jgi:hypothetical protein